MYMFVYAEGHVCGKFLPEPALLRLHFYYSASEHMMFLIARIAGIA